MEQKTSFDFQAIITKVKEWRNQLRSGKKGRDAKQAVFSFGIKRQTYLHALIVFGGVVLLCAVLIGLVIMRLNQLNKQLPQLQELSHYQLTSFTTNELIAEEKDHLPHSISELITFYDTTKLAKERIENELNFKKSVYADFLRNILLPSLNIWKNPYTQEIDLSILGKKYLDHNPYQDIALLGQWSSIIRDSGKDIGTNEVVNMQIGDIEEEDNGFFRIPISIAFKSDSKRAFLLLVDKLSLTSNINNIGLFSDFTYQLFEVIRANKQERLDQLAEDYHMQKETHPDERMFYNFVIAQYLYTLIQSGELEENLLVDNAIIDQVVRETVLCTQDEAEDQCYFRFRDKYRTLPGLAYSIGVESNSNKVALLNEFYASIPPLIAIQSFNFDKAKSQGLMLANEGEYVGSVNFNIYGRGITMEESNEISQLLTTACFGSGSSMEMNLSGALEKIEEKLKLVGASSLSDSKVATMSNLLELKDSFLESAASYNELSPYNQMIKKFEIYRELKNLSLCTI